MAGYRKTTKGLFMSFLFVVADLLVKLAKEKFGAIQTEYQKVTLCVLNFKLFFCCFPFALLHYVFLIGSCNSR